MNEEITPAPDGHICSESAGWPLFLVFSLSSLLALGVALVSNRCLRSRSKRITLDALQAGRISAAVSSSGLPSLGSVPGGYSFYRGGSVAAPVAGSFASAAPLYQVMAGDEDGWTPPLKDVVTDRHWWLYTCTSLFALGRLMLGLAGILVPLEYYCNNVGKDTVAQDAATTPPYLAFLSAVVLLLCSFRRLTDTGGRRPASQAIQSYDVSGRAFGQAARQPLYTHTHDDEADLEQDCSLRCSLWEVATAHHEPIIVAAVHVVILASLLAEVLDDATPWLQYGSSVVGLALGIAAAVCATVVPCRLRSVEGIPCVVLVAVITSSAALAASLLLRVAVLNPFAQRSVADWMGLVTSPLSDIIDSVSFLVAFYALHRVSH